MALYETGAGLAYQGMAELIPVEAYTGQLDVLASQMSERVAADPTLAAGLGALSANTFQTNFLDAGMAQSYVEASIGKPPEEQSVYVALFEGHVIGPAERYPGLETHGAHPPITSMTGYQRAFVDRHFFGQNQELHRAVLADVVAGLAQLTLAQPEQSPSAPVPHALESREFTTWLADIYGAAQFDAAFDTDLNVTQGQTTIDIPRGSTLFFLNPRVLRAAHEELGRT